MNYNLKEYGKQVEITGYRKISFTKVDVFLKKKRKQPQRFDLQFFDADRIATEEHLYFAVLNALQAFKNKTNISKSLAMETMLYASTQRQILKSIDHIGVKPETKNLAIIIIGEPDQIKSELQTLKEYLGLEVDETTLEITENKEEIIQKTVKITEEEIKAIIKENRKRAIADLVIEKMALLATQF